MSNAVLLVELVLVLGAVVCVLGVFAGLAVRLARGEHRQWHPRDQKEVTHFMFHDVPRLIEGRLMIAFLVFFLALWLVATCAD